MLVIRVRGWYLACPDDLFEMGRLQIESLSWEAVLPCGCAHSLVAQQFGSWRVRDT